MTEKPIWVQNFNRPQGTEIKHIGNHWYLYERLSIYDHEKKCKRKKSGRCLGTIKETGFVPSKRHSPIAKIHDIEIETREYGATKLLVNQSANILERLKKNFPDSWREIYVLAILKCKEQAPLQKTDFFYHTSYLGELFPGLSLSASRISEILRMLGNERERIKKYMKEDLGEDSKIVFDGHRIISNSNTLEYARVGYDSKRRFMPQVNLIYMFDVSESKRFPVFYKQFSGDVPDVAAFSDILIESHASCKKSLVIADKGFKSRINEEIMSDSSLYYLLAIRRGCADMKNIPDRPDSYQYVFPFRDRAIYCSEYEREDYKIFLFYDMALANDETLDTVKRLVNKNQVIEVKHTREEKRRSKGKARLSEEEYNNLTPIDIAEAMQQKRSTGTFILKTNKKELNCMQAYYLYKIRNEIEDSFNSYDSTLDCSASYMRHQDSFEGWLFINHLSLQILYNVINYISEKDLTNQYSFKDVMDYLKGIRVDKIEGKWILTKMTKHNKKICDDLGIIIQSPENDEDSLK